MVPFQVGVPPKAVFPIKLDETTPPAVNPVLLVVAKLPPLDVPPFEYRLSVVAVDTMQT